MYFNNPPTIFLTISPVAKSSIHLLGTLCTLTWGKKEKGVKIFHNFCIFSGFGSIHSKMRTAIKTSCGLDFVMTHTDKNIDITTSMINRTLATQTEPTSVCVCVCVVMRQKGALPNFIPHSPFLLYILSPPLPTLSLSLSPFPSLPSLANLHNSTIGKELHKNLYIHALEALQSSSM